MKSARRPRLTSKILFFSALLIAVAAAWFALRMRHAAEQKTAAAAIHRLGGRTYYNCRYHDTGNLRNARVPGPAWLQKLVGRDFLADVNGVFLTEEIELEGLADFEFLTRPLAEVTDGDLAHLRAFDELEWLALGGTAVGDAGLENIRGLSNLQRLWLSGTQVTDAGMERLRNLRNLRVLWLDNTRITDAGLGHIEHLAKLEVLSLADTAVGDDGLFHLQGMTALQTLRLNGTHCTFSGVVRLLVQLQNRSLVEALNVVTHPKFDEAGHLLALDLSELRTTDAGLVHLRGFTRIEWLFLGRTQVTDAGLVHLMGLKRLTLLDLAGTQVTDAGLEHLRGLQQLRTLHLGGTRVTEEGIRRLQETLPQTTRIYRVSFAEED